RIENGLWHLEAVGIVNGEAFDVWSFAFFPEEGQVVKHLDEQVEFRQVTGEWVHFKSNKAGFHLFNKDAGAFDRIGPGHAAGNGLPEPARGMYQKTARSTCWIEQAFSNDGGVAVCGAVKHKFDDGRGRQEVAFLITRHAINKGFVSKAKQVVGNVLEIVHIQALKRESQQVIVGHEPVKNGLLKEVPVETHDATVNKWKKRFPANFMDAVF